MFEEAPKETFPKREERILAWWREHHTFQSSLELRKGAKRFSFYDGPPFATGLPHYGHLLAGTLKDVVPRYKTMRGYYVERRFGWDCHGLPVENEIEKTHDLSGASAITDFGIDRFNEACRSIVLRYSAEWKKTVERMGRWVDFERTYHTMDPSYMESVWWVFKQLFDKGLVYEGFKVMPFSWKLGTPLSNFEATANYREVDDPSLTVIFPLKETPETSLLVWTTTPWTLVSNLAVAVSADILYVKIFDKGKGASYILAHDRLSAYYKDAGDYEILDTFPGSSLEGLHYEPPFPYFLEQGEKGAFRVLIGSFVATEQGTGIVHTAPAFGEDDYYACQQAGIGLVCPVDHNGRFTEEIPEYAGEFVKDADKDIAKRLKACGRLFHQGTCHHRYPYCWRSDTPLIYKAVNTWFVAVEKIKDVLIAAQEEVNWVPEHLKIGRFGKWLENARDWAVSRNRYWGTPIPLWRADDGDIVVVGSLDELEKLSGKRPDDLHRHHIDPITFEHRGKTFRRIPEVFDCWFDTGAMPYAQNHYPFENREVTENSSPADFIAEGLDQTRGWFYTLSVLAAALFKRPAFKNVVVNGIILAEDGQKMSKRLKNYPEPELVLQKYGADAIRLYLLSSPAVGAEDLRFSEQGVELTLRQILIPLWNAYSGFFLTYARIYRWKPHGHRPHPQAAIDQWILSLTHSLVHDVQEAMDRYDLQGAVTPLIAFIDQLTNWYIRRSRRRFWADEDSQDRNEAFATLHAVLLTFCQVAAPFAPFITEAIYGNLRSLDMPASVHLCDYPVADASLRQVELEESMKVVQKAVSLGHSLRKEHKLKVRQPLRVAHLATPNAKTRHFLETQRHLIEEELNVKSIVLHEEESPFVTLQAKPNFRTLGKKVGPLMRAVQQALEKLDQHQLKEALDQQSLTLDLEGKSFLLSMEDLSIFREVREGMIALNDGDLTIALETKLDDELLLEGLARELINKVQTMRRDSGFEVTDRIVLSVQAGPQVQRCLAQHAPLIQEEVLATSLLIEPCEGTAWDLNGEMTTLAVKKV